MEENKLDKSVDKFVNGFEHTINFIKRILNSPIFFITLIFFYFLGLLLNTWQLIFRFERLDKIFLFNLLTFICSGYILYSKLKTISDIDLKILKFSRKFYSAETVKLCFEPIISDWKIEYSEAISQNSRWKTHIISARYFYAFLAAMFQQSRLGRLFELIQKIGK